MSETNEKLTYTVQEAAARLGLCKNAMYSAVKRGDVFAVRVGDRLLIPKARLEKLLSGNNGQQPKE